MKAGALAAPPRAAAPAPQLKPIPRNPTLRQVWIGSREGRWPEYDYRTLSVPRDSVHFGPNVKAYVRACREIASIIEDAMRRALAARPEAGFLEVARAATDLVAERLPITKDEDGLPLYGNVEAFYGYWQLLK